MSVSFLSVLWKVPYSCKEVWRFVVCQIRVGSRLGALETTELHALTISSVAVSAPQTAPEARVYCEWPERSWGQWFKGESFREIWCGSI